MNWLARLKKTEISPGTDPTKPTKPPFVGFVGNPAGTFENSGIESAAANDATPDPDRWCWPQSSAMNTVEIDTFTARLSRFTDKGLPQAVGEMLADKLVLRDREQDDRRVCLECNHFAGHGAGSWRCGNWQAAGVAIRSRDAQLPADLVVQLQRCNGFTAHLTSTPKESNDEHDHH